MTIAQALIAGRRAMASLELGIVQFLLDEYGVAWRHIEGRLTDVEGMIEAALARGETVDPSWLNRQQWWSDTLTSIEDQMQRYTGTMAQKVGSGQQTAVQTSRQVSSAMAEYLQQQATQRGVAVGPGIRGQINPGAFERWVVAQQPGNPVRQAIDRYGDRVSQAIRSQMTEGLASGEHPRTIARKIAAEVGPNAVEGRIQTITRTETHRAYRGAAADAFAAMEQSGAVVGYRWLAALSHRTCAACLAMHNQVFTDYPTSQHVACRCAVSPVLNPAIIPARPSGQTGEEWLRKQPDPVQREVLGPGRFDAFRGGTPLADMVGVKYDEVWGESVVLKPLREVRTR